MEVSFRLLFMVIIGGLELPIGGFFGAAFIVVLPIVLNQFLPAFMGLFGIEMSTAGVSHAELMIFGALIVWFLIVEPHGLAKLWSTAKQKLVPVAFPALIKRRCRKPPASPDLQDCSPCRVNCLSVVFFPCFNTFIQRRFIHEAFQKS